MKQLLLLVTAVFILAAKGFSAIYLTAPLQDHTTIDQKPQFTWKGTTAAATYTLYIDTDQNPFDSQTAADVTGLSSFSPTANLDIAVPYYWGIREMSDTDTIYSVVRRFYITKAGHGGFFSLKDTAMHTFAPDTDAGLRLCSADIDGDGLMDIIGSTFNDRNLFWCRSLPNGDMGEKTILGEDLLSPYDLFAEDMDGDSDIDIVVACYNNESDQILLYRNDGTGQFSVGTKIYTLVKPKNIAPVDYNGDGLLDIAVTSNSSTPVAVLTNKIRISNVGGVDKQYQSFILKTIESNVDLKPNDVCVGDFTGNGYSDLLVTFEQDSTISLYKNNHGSFSSHQIITDTLKEADKLDICDIDNDGDMDFFVGSNATSHNLIAWYENNGTATFSAHSIVPELGNSPFIDDMTLADIDGNGFTDLVVLDTYEIFWYANDGSGNFADAQFATFSLSSGTPLCIVDMDRNGVPDIVASTSRDEKLVWFRNIDGFPNQTEFGMGYYLVYNDKIATICGGINFLDNETIIEKGFCWGTDSLPTIDNSTVHLSTYLPNRTGLISASLSTLVECQKYYARVFIKTASGIRYSSVREFYSADKGWPTISWEGADPVILAKGTSSTVAMPDFTSGVTVSDNCDLSFVKVTQSPAPGSSVKGPKIQVAFEAVDRSGNNAHAYVYATFKAMDRQSIQLREGLNLINIYLDPQETDLAAMFPDATSVKTFDGFFNNEMPPYLNSVAESTSSVILVESPAQKWVSVYGLYHTSYQVQTLTKGWNAIGVPYYGIPLPLSKLPAETVKIKNLTQFYDPTTGEGTLERLMPWEGYFIEVSDDCQIDWSLYSDNTPPRTPSSMKPANASTLTGTEAILSWSSSDSDGDDLFFTILFDTNAQPETVLAENIAEKTFTATGLTAGTTYFWQVIVYDSFGHFAKSGVQSFTTGQ